LAYVGDQTIFNGCRVDSAYTFPLDLPHRRIRLIHILGLAKQQNLSKRIKKGVPGLAGVVRAEMILQLQGLLHVVNRKTSCKTRVSRGLEPFCRRLSNLLKLVCRDCREQSFVAAADELTWRRLHCLVFMVRSKVVKRFNFIRFENIQYEIAFVAPWLGCRQP
jgi:hypothetical protein